MDDPLNCIDVYRQAFGPSRPRCGGGNNDPMAFPPPGKITMEQAALPKWWHGDRKTGGTR